MSTPPTSLGNCLDYYKGRTAQIFSEPAAFSRDDIKHQLGPELDLGDIFATTTFTPSDSPVYPPTSRFACDLMSNRTSTTSSSRTITPSSILITPPQTPPDLHPTFSAEAPSPLCLGPSLSRIHRENDLEDVCLDEPCDDGYSFGEGNELPELVRPQTSCDTIMNRTNTTSSGLITPPQTPPGLHATSFGAAPSPLCLGPSLSRTHPEKDLEDICLDEPFDDGSDVDEDDELYELITPPMSRCPGGYHCELMNDRTGTTTSFLITPFQTPLCLGPSLCRTYPENDLEDICLDGSDVGEDDELPPFQTLGPSLCRTHPEKDLEDICLDGSDVGEDDELPELVTPVTPFQTLGPSLCRTHPEKDLEDICLDESYDDDDDDGNNGDEDDEHLNALLLYQKCAFSRYDF
ncbi:hypothetical protein AGABI1DRAFT_126123 [Agaricus bisporus var. burnettii JB137-S8]|uniref:Uncharacterized protein n=1 Tax=Agaricus bisporus var. burnettii (strain JB137-S8 / ATCC MYA-4627 / FGSC 10392) TaxID=597362 RepID=K5Y1R9_AGABU|nr:uncharacterized protein AGABI1DRAFT_126123 [Agaricus bisporus var. burnettii JB137-S8]EKM81765.1 hypothetical protein AGABI1DRAFT_126123 [Agaricus bisporus var. burnettii JB137-S8]